MVPRDEEDFSTLDASEPVAEPAPPPIARKPAPASTPSPVPPPQRSILTNEPLAELCKRVRLSDRASQMVSLHSTPLPLVDALVRQELYEDATRLLAHALPRREAVGWALRCAQQAHLGALSPEIDAALAAAGNWVRNPTEESRRAAHKAAEKAGLASPAGRACAAIFLAGPDADLPPELCKPGKSYAAVAVVATVLAAVATAGTAPKADRFARLLAEGRMVAGGARPWENAR